MFFSRILHFVSSLVGKNNGTVKGHYYFTCLDNHGLFVRPTAVRPDPFLNKQGSPISPSSAEPSPQATDTKGFKPPTEEQSGGVGLDSQVGKIKELEDRIADSERHVNELKALLEEEVVAREIAEEESIVWKTKAETLSQEQVELESKLKKVKSESEKELKDREATIRSLESEREGLKTDIVGLKRAMAEIDNDYKQEKVEAGLLREQLEKALKRIEEAETKAEAQQRGEEKAKEGKLKAQAQALKEDVGRLRGQVDQLKRELEWSRKEVSTEKATRAKEELTSGLGHGRGGQEGKGGSRLAELGMTTSLDLNSGMCMSRSGSIDSSISSPEVIASPWVEGSTGQSQQGDETQHIKEWDGKVGEGRSQTPSFPLSHLMMSDDSDETAEPLPEADMGGREPCPAEYPPQGKTAREAPNRRDTTLKHPVSLPSITTTTATSRHIESSSPESMTHEWLETFLASLPSPTSVDREWQAWRDRGTSEVGKGEVIKGKSEGVEGRGGGGGSDTWARNQDPILQLRETVVIVQKEIERLERIKAEVEENRDQELKDHDQRKALLLSTS